MADGDVDDAARTSAGLRRPGAVPARPVAAEAAATGLGRRREVDPGRPPSADATGLGVRRTGSAPTTDAETSVVGLRLPTADTPGTPDATGLGRRRGTADRLPAAPDATGRGRRSTTPEPPVAGATGLGMRRTGSAPSADAATSMVGLRLPTGGLPAGTTGPGRAVPPGATGHGARRPVPAGPHDVVRFGPGAPSGPPPAAPTWQRSPSEEPAPRPRRRRRPVVGGLLTLLAVAAVVAYLLTRPTVPVGIEGVRVAAQPAAATCDTTVVLVGTVATDGTGGTFRYRWERSDGQVGEILTQSVGAGSRSTDVRLQWTVSGPGRLDASATLRVLDGAPVVPDAAVGTGQFTYACG